MSVKYASATMKVDKQAVDWVVKVFTVGGTLALSGGVVGRDSFQTVPASLFFEPPQPSTTAGASRFPLLMGTCQMVSKPCVLCNVSPLHLSPPLMRPRYRASRRRPRK